MLFFIIYVYAIYVLYIYILYIHIYYIYYNMHILYIYMCVLYIDRDSERGFYFYYYLIALLNLSVINQRTVSNAVVF